MKRGKSASRPAAVGADKAAVPRPAPSLIAQRGAAVDQALARAAGQLDATDANALAPRPKQAGWWAQPGDGAAVPAGRAAPRREPAEGASVFVRNLSEETTGEQLESMFSDVGPVRRAFIVKVRAWARVCALPTP